MNWLGKILPQGPDNEAELKFSERFLLYLVVVIVFKLNLYLYFD